MGFVTFLLVATIAFIVCPHGVSSSRDVKAAIPQDFSLHLVSSADAISARLLRTNDIRDDESDEEERANAFYEKVATFVSKLTGKETGIKAETEKKTAVGIVRNYWDPPLADKLTRANSFPVEKAAAPKLARSPTYSGERVTWDDAIDAAKNIVKSYKDEVKRGFKVWDAQKRDPDELFTFFSLDPKLAKTTKADKHLLREAAKGDEYLHGEYVLWYKYTKYYKQKHPHWISKIGKEKLD